MLIIYSLKGTHNSMGPEPTSDDLGGGDASTPSQASLVLPREKKKVGASWAWDKLKKPLMKRFGS